MTVFLFAFKPPNDYHEGIAESAKDRKVRKDLVVNFAILSALCDTHPMILSGKYVPY